MRIILVTLCMFVASLFITANELPPRNSLENVREYMNLLNSFTGKIKSGLTSPAFIFFIDKSTSEIEDFTQKVDKLKMKMSEDTVRELLGEPTLIQKPADKKTGKISKIYWNYYLKKKDKDSANEKWDVYLFLIFSPDVGLLEDVKLSKGAAYE